MERRGIRTEVGDRVREEQRRELQLRLEKAAELGALERETQQLQKSILDLSGDLSAALKERDQAKELVAEVRIEGQEALNAFRKQFAEEKSILKDLTLERAKELERTAQRDKALELEKQKGRERTLGRDGPDFEL